MSERPKAGRDGGEEYADEGAGNTPFAAVVIFTVLVLIFCAFSNDRMVEDPRKKKQQKTLTIEVEKGTKVIIKEK